MKNHIDSYRHEAKQCAVAMNEGDIARSRSHKEYFNRMRAMEVHADQCMLSNLFQDTYKMNRR